VSTPPNRCLWCVDGVIQPSGVLCRTCAGTGWQGASNSAIERAFQTLEAEGYDRDELLDAATATVASWRATYPATHPDNDNENGLKSMTKERIVEALRALVRGVNVDPDAPEAAAAVRNVATVFYCEQDIDAQRVELKEAIVTAARYGRALELQKRLAALELFEARLAEDDT
jgi:hypothetical protein